MNEKRTGSNNDRGMSGVGDMRARAAKLQVSRSLRDGWYVYTCDKLPGLLVSSKDDQKAYDDLPRAIKAIFKLDYDEDVLVAHLVDYDQFLSSICDDNDQGSSANDRRSDLAYDAADIVPFLVGRMRELTEQHERWSDR